MSRTSPKKSPTTSKIRFAVVGLGHIAQTAVLPAFKNARKNSSLVALFSDDPKKLKVLGKKYGVEILASYDEFESTLKLGLIDAVYIATPNTEHEKFVLAAARQGVHILCEKPLGVTEDECQRMMKAAKDKQVKLMTAYRLHFEKANLKAGEIARSGKLGDLRAFTSTFSYQIKDRENIRLKKELGGGPLYDIGIYCVNAARSIFHEAPVEVFAKFVSRPADSRFTEVEEMVSAVMTFPDEKIASFTCSFGMAPAGYYEVLGTKGRLVLENAYEYVEPMEMVLEINEKKSKRHFKKRDQFAPELLYFADCILKDKEVETSAKEAMADVRILQALIRSNKEGRPVKLKAFHKELRPTMKQEMHRPPVSKVDQIRATSPSG